MKVLLTSAVVFACFLVISCAKHSTPPNQGSGANSIFPLVQGSVWYYADSAFSDSTVTAAYIDTMTVTKNTYQDQSGTVYVELNDTYGWFFGSYISVDPSNNAIYEVDSPYYSPYTFFAVPTQDNQIIGTGTDYTNPACPVVTTQYGWITPVMIGTYSCLRNVEYSADCNGNPQEEIDSYVAQGIGVVRIAHYVPDSATGPLHEDYSQTLQTYQK
ncbi:MAG TPA: hypothetical protein VG052_13320 [Puia sp.]|jgi:hypothetical protein|nr:hypothetical protein [Puia sp.]